MPCLLHHFQFETNLKICFVEASNTDAPSHTRTAQVIMTEYNKRFQQVRIFDKFTEADPSADIHFSLTLCRRSHQAGRQEHQGDSKAELLGVFKNREC